MARVLQQGESMNTNTSQQQNGLGGSRLNYLNLAGVGGWHFAIHGVGAQLKPYRDYLRAAIRAAEWTKPRLAWRTANDEEVKVFIARWRERHAEKHRRTPSRQRGHKWPVGDESLVEQPPTDRWIVLEAPPDRPEESDETFDSFLDAKEIYDTEKCTEASRIRKVDYDREGRALLLEDLPAPVEMSGSDNGEPILQSLIWLRSDTYALKRQENAIYTLDNAPAQRHAPLTRLMVSRPDWPVAKPAELSEEEWTFLRSPEANSPLRDGTDEQRRFVEMALGTPDFALLEGPPGSGKTTAICEFIVQLARRGKRVLLVASTHVAVDNVLERLLAWQDERGTNEKLVLPVRIGDEGKVTSDAVEPWCYQRLLRTWRERLQNFLEQTDHVDTRGDAARHMLLQALRERGESGGSAISNLILESSNLVCGTTIGILQHPAIKAIKDGVACEPFDVLILDEASKTTFSEFLVPALHANRWVVVGDIRQLSPYVEQQYLEDNLRALVPAAQAAAAAQAFKAKKSPRWLPVENEELRQFIVKECEQRRLHLADLDAVFERELRGIAGAIPELLYADLIIGRPETLRRLQRRLPVDMIAAGQKPMEFEDWNAAHAAWKHTQRHLRDHEEKDWAEEIAWRLVRSYELRQNEQECDRYNQEISGLLPASLDNDWFKARGLFPAWPDGTPKIPADELLRELQNLRRCTFPSILELLQTGFERVSQRHDAVALTDGLPKEELNERLVSLSYQHRMHPDISAFPREQFYTEREAQPIPLYNSSDFQLLQDARGMVQRREWDYPRYAKRAVWVEVTPERKRRSRGNENPAEVEVMLEELRQFVEWAAAHPRSDGKPWDVAVLTFYRAQEKLLRHELQQISRARANTRNFKLPAGGSAVHVTLCTVDRFQGHEADLVLLSFVKSGSVGFLNSPNRLNVAITRARYLLVLIGHRAYFASERCPSELLCSLATSHHYAHGIAY